MMTRICTYLAMLTLTMANYAQGQDDHSYLTTQAALAAFLNIVEKMEAGDIAGLQKMILSTNVLITTEPRASGSEGYGDDINIPFVHSGFDKEIQSIRSRTSVVQIRTMSSSFWLQKDKDGRWKLIKYRDEPIEEKSNKPP